MKIQSQNNHHRIPLLCIYIHTLNKRKKEREEANIYLYEDDDHIMKKYAHMHTLCTEIIFILFY